MARTISSLSGNARRVAALVLARFSPERDVQKMHDWLASLPAGRQWRITGGVIGLLLVLSLLAAAFGPIGLAIYFILIVLLFRPR